MSLDQQTFSALLVVILVTLSFFFWHNIITTIHMIIELIIDFFKTRTDIAIAIFGTIAVLGIGYFLLRTSMSFAEIGVSDLNDTIQRMNTMQKIP